MLFVWSDGRFELSKLSNGPKKGMTLKQRRVYALEGRSIVENFETEEVAKVVELCN